jgi:hypothetical protein
MIIVAFLYVCVHVQVDCDVVSNIVINFYGAEVGAYREELRVLLTNYSAPSRLKVDIYPTQFGLGHRFHVFEEHGYAAAQSPLVINMDDDVMTTCPDIQRAVARLSNDPKQPAFPVSDLLALSLVRGVRYKGNGDIQYLMKGKAIALTISFLLPVELMKFFADVMPAEMLAVVDDVKNCEDIMMNFVSAFLNKNDASKHKIEIVKNIRKLRGHGLSHKNTLFTRSCCVYWLDKIFRRFDTKLLY